MMSKKKLMTSNLPTTSAARRLIDALISWNIDTFFGIPGGPICPLFEAIRLHPQAKLIESRHESHAAFSAALYYRATKKVSAVVVTAGPGATNAMTGIASAYLERTPILVIAGDVPSSSNGKLLAQDSGPNGIHIEAMYAPITRGQFRTAKGNSVITQACAALQCAINSANPGPTLFILPLDHSTSPCEYQEIPNIGNSQKTFTSDQAVVDRTHTLLSKAKRPLIVLGAGCHGHEKILLKFFNSINIPFVTTPSAKGIVSENHANSLRNGGIAASIWARKYTEQPIDVCLALGTSLDDAAIGPTPYLGSQGTLIHVDLNPDVIGRNLPTALCSISDLADFIGRLGRKPLTNPNTAAVIKKIKSQSPFDVALPSQDDWTPIRPHRLLAELEAAASKGTRFITDIGEHMLFALHYLTAEPNSFYIQLNLGSMASGIAGAIGLAVAEPHKPVICIAGDGCMQMAGMEALVALKEKLPILFVVFNDGRYNMVHHGMKQIFGEADTYHMPPIDFSRWAKSMGIPSVTINEPGEITKSLFKKLLKEGPALLDVKIDASIRIRCGGRVEALQHMSMLSKLVQETPV
jgi:acetolactate synthase-1/2/3 large subunit